MARESAASPAIRDTLAAESAKAAWMAAAAAALVGVCALVLGIGPSVIDAAPWDVFALLDGGWRVYNGKVPNTDFYATVGPLIYWLLGLGMHVGGPTMQAFVAGNVIVLAAIGPWALFVFFRKFAPPLAFLLTIFTALLVSATHPLGWAPEASSYAMIYNRYAWALSAILCAHLLLQDRAPSARPGALDALCAGLIIALLFLCKISYFFLGAGALGLALALRPELRPFAWRAAAAFAAVCILAAAALGFRISDYFRDIAFAAGAQSPSMLFETVKQLLKFNFIKGLLFAGVWLALVAWPCRQGRLPLAEASRLTLISAFIIGASMLVSIGNAIELGDLPLFFLAGAILLEAWLRKSDLQRMQRSNAILGAAIVVIGVFFGTIFGRDALSLAYSNAWRAYRDGAAPQAQRLHSAHYRDLSLPHTSSREAAYAFVNETPEKLNGAIALLQGHVSPTSRLVALTVADPFSMALGLPPSRGAPLWWHRGATFNPRRPPPPERVFEEADFVIYPALPDERGCCQDTVRILLDVYGDHLRGHFVEIARSHDWVLLKRRPLADRD